MIHEPEFDGQVPREIVERRVERCRVLRSEIRSIEPSTATIIAILALYAAFFQTVNVSLADFTDLAAQVIVLGFYSWILSFILLFFLDIRLRAEASVLVEMLDQYDYAGGLPSATQFFNRHPGNKFRLQTWFALSLARIAPVLFLIGLAGSFRGGAFIGIIIIAVLAFVLSPVSLLFPPDHVPSLLSRLRMIGMRMAFMWFWRDIKRIPLKIVALFNQFVQWIRNVVKRTRD